MCNNADEVRQFASEYQRANERIQRITAEVLTRQGADRPAKKIVEGLCELWLDDQPLPQATSDQNLS